MDRRLTTIVAADLAGFSRLMAADEEGVIRRLRAARAEVVDPAVAEAGGRIVKTMGDGLLVEYPSPVAAVRSVIAVQEEMAARETGPEDQRLRFRVGINLGDIVEDGDDILGDAVNVAARLESLAAPGGICISRSVHDQLRGKSGRPMSALGPQMVKNIPDPVEVWSIEIEGAAKVAAAKAEPAGVAVLPFDNMSSDPEQEFLADGIVEDVITELSRFRSLFVIARNSTFSYKGTHKDIRRIARELGVRYVVEGSVRRGGDRVRLTAQLIDAETGAHVWADRWDRVIDDLFAMQDELTAAIVTAVEPELGAHERKLARARPSESLSAWELFHQAMSEGMKFVDGSLETSRALLNRAVELDPDFSAAHAMLARTSWVAVGTGRSADPAGEIARGVASARRAIEIDDRQELAYTGLGVLLAMGGDVSEGMACIEKAVALNPNNATCHHAMAMACLFQDSPDAALMENSSRAAIRLSPRDPRAFIHHYLAGVGAWVGAGYEYTEATLRDFRNACSFQNADWYVLLGAAAAFAATGEADHARSYLRRAIAWNPQVSLEAYRRNFFNPAWETWFEQMRPELEKLVELGLPRE